MLFAGSGYIAADPPTTALNADVIHFPFGAALLYQGLRAAQRRSLTHRLAFALACSGAFYAKYTVLLFQFALGIASLVVAKYRALGRDRGFYIAVGLFCLLISPHLLAVAHTASTSEYAMESFEFDRSVSARAHDPGQIALGFVLFLFPSWFTVGAAVRFNGAHLATKKEPVARFIRVATLASLALLAILVVGGLRFLFRYDSPYAFLAPTLAATCIRFDALKWPITKRWIMGVAVIAPLMTLICIVLNNSVFSHHFFLQEPTAEAAREIGAEWARRYNCGPAYIVGDTRSAYGLAINWSPPRPGIPFERMDNTPWYDASLREKLGAMIVFHDKLEEKSSATVLSRIEIAASGKSVFAFRAHVEPQRSSDLRITFRSAERLLRSALDVIGARREVNDQRAARRHAGAVVASGGATQRSRNRTNVAEAPRETVRVFARGRALALAR